MLEAARAAFGKLNDAEETLVVRFASGEAADFGEPAEGEWGPKVQARLLPWLLVNSSMADGSRVEGLHIVGVDAVDDTLELDGISADFPVILEHCRLGTVHVRDARFLTLKLSGTHCRGLKGDRMRVQHGLLLNNGFRSHGQAFLPAIRVGDDLHCGAGGFATAGEGLAALVLDGAHVSGRLYLNDVVGAPDPEADGHRRANEDPGKAGRISAQGAKIGGNLICIGGKYEGLDLRSASIGGDAAFERVETSRTLTLYQGEVTGTVTLGAARLPAGLNLARASIGGDLRFDYDDRRKDGEAILEEKLRLEGARVEGRADLGRVDLSAVGKIDLSRCKIGYLGDSETVWPATEGSVSLEGVELGGIGVRQPTMPGWKDRIGDRLGHERAPTWLEGRRSWLKAQGEGKWSPQPYGQVVAALKLAGDDSLAREVAIAREKQRHEWGGLNWPSQAWNSLLRRVIVYGYKPYFAFLWGAAVIAIGWLVFSSSLGHVEFQRDMDAPALHSLVYSIDVFLPIVDLGQAGAYRPVDWWPSLVYWLEIGLGWILTTLGVAGITGLIRND